MLGDLTKRELMRMSDEFDYFSEHCLKVMDKRGSIVPLVLNAPQRLVHQKLEEQRRNGTGKVRALLLKARQQGMSTYVEGRFYWRVRFHRGVKAFILTHLQEATDNLFAMTCRYHDNMPAALRPSTAAANAKELYFNVMDSGFKVATAGSKGVGRGSTAQLFHGSEMAFWNNADEHMAGIGQVVPDAPGTEIILESTANGPGNLFYGMWQDAMKGLNDYVPIFTPWFMSHEYRRDAEGFEPSPEELALSEIYGLDMQQLAWRRAKISNDFRGDDRLFKQEYPSTADEAFMLASDDSLINPDHVSRSFGLKDVDMSGVKVMGLDPAEYGDDETVLVTRTGRVHHGTKVWTKRSPMEVVGLVSDAYAKEDPKPAAVFVDVVGLGTGIADRLREIGIPVVRVHSGERALADDIYLNKRAEMWGNMRDWFQDGPVSIMSDEVLRSQLVAVRYSYDSSRRLKLEKKEDMKKRGIKSPDRADALALTFAETIHRPTQRDRERRTYNWRVG